MKFDDMGENVLCLSEALADERFLPCYQDIWISIPQE